MTIVRHALLKLRQFNLFVDAKTKNEQDGQMLRDQILSTRIYLVFLIISVLILALFTLFTEVIVRVTVNNPSFNTYKHLEAAFPDTLSCLCDQVAIPYSSFISIETTYHQVSVVVQAKIWS